MKQKNFFKIAFLLSILLLSYNSFAQLSIDSDSTNYTVDFDNSLSGVNNGVFDGSGLTSSPASGNLDGDAWEIDGFSDGTHNFGDTNTSGDFSRGTSTGGVSSGGLYAFEVATSNYALGFQGTSGDFTPGTMVLKVLNNTGAPITSIDVSYKIWVYNDQGRGSTLNFSHSTDNSTFTDVGALNHTTTLVADGSPSWVSIDKTTTIGSLNIAPGLSYYIKWSSSDAGGSGSRDEIAIDDIIVNATTGAATPTIGFDSATSTVEETDSDVVTAGIPISLINYGGNITITPTVNGSSTAEPADYTIDLSPIEFDANETLNIPLTIKDDADMDNETIVIDFTVTSGTATLGISQHTVTITDDDLPNIIINELLADPTGIDANGDGTVSTTNDEFVELVNLDGSSYDLTGYTISDATSTRYTFGTVTIPAGGSVVIFGGGTPTGIPGISDTAGGLSLNNSSETVTLKNSGGNTIATYSYGSEAADDQSIGRSDDSSGGFVKHSTISSNPVTASPGRTNVSGLPFTPLTWAGTTNNWETDSNWSSGSKPTSSDDVVIPSGLSIYPTVTTTETVNSVTLNSGASLLAKDATSFTGVITYNRQIDFVYGNLKAWYLMSSPVVGETYNDGYATLNGLATSSTRRGLATYSAGSWTYLQDDDSNAATFTSGVGYSIKKGTATGKISFTGTLNTNDVGIDVNLSTAGNRFNLLGNPYTSYISSAYFLDGANAESSISETKTIWVYNQTLGTDGQYEVKDVDDAFIIAPGQGFFVKANTAGGTFNFAESNQAHNNPDTFQKNAGKTEIKLWISDGSIKTYNRIKYRGYATTAFDVGYEGELFSEASNSFAIFSHLVSNSQGKDYQLQSLPNSNYENMIVPIGIIADSGKEITFTAEALNLPTGIKVFLEDRFTNTFTRLDTENGEYTIKSKEAFDGTGRFYLHTKESSVLNSNTEFLSSVTIYKTNNRTLKITGLQEGRVKLSLFNILGKTIMQQSFKASNSNNITLPNLSSGVYMVRVQTLKGTITKKIILE